MNGSTKPGCDWKYSGGRLQEFASALLECGLMRQLLIDRAFLAPGSAMIEGYLLSVFGVLGIASPISSPDPEVVGEAAFAGEAAGAFRHTRAGSVGLSPVSGCWRPRR